VAAAVGNRGGRPHWGLSQTGCRRRTAFKRMWGMPPRRRYTLI